MFWTLLDMFSPDDLGSRSSCYGDDDPSVLGESTYAIDTDRNGLYEAFHSMARMISISVFGLTRWVPWLARSFGCVSQYVDKHDCKEVRKSMASVDDLTVVLGAHARSTFYQAAVAV